MSSPARTTLSSVGPAAILSRPRGNHASTLFLLPQTSSATFERISADPAKMAGAPCVRDTRVTVSAVLGQLAAGRTFEQILDDYPYLEREDILEVLAYAAATIGHDLPFVAA